MARLDGDNRRGPVLLLLLLLCAGLSFWHSRAARTQRLDPVSGVVRDAALVPAQTGAERLAVWWRLSVVSVFHAPALARRNGELQKQMLALSLENQGLKKAQAENDRLRQLLAFETRATQPLLVAEVVALKPSPQTDTLTLNRGTRSGVRPRASVLAPNGALVGQVLDVSPNGCNVLLLTDADSSVGAQVDNDSPRAPIGLCQGGGGPRLILTYLPLDCRLQPGDLVYTSGQGGVFPKGFPIGKVISVSVDKTRSLKTAVVQPKADFDHLEEAFVAP